MREELGGSIRGTVKAGYSSVAFSVERTTLERSATSRILDTQIRRLHNTPLEHNHQSRCRITETDRLRQQESSLTLIALLIVKFESTGDHTIPLLPRFILDTLLALASLTRKIDINVSHTNEMPCLILLRLHRSYVCRVMEVLLEWAIDFLYGVPALLTACVLLAVRLLEEEVLAVEGGGVDVGFPGSAVDFVLRDAFKPVQYWVLARLVVPAARVDEGGGGRVGHNEGEMWEYQLGWWIFSEMS